MENNLVGNSQIENEEEIYQSKGVDIERIRNAKKRRSLQLKRWSQYDKSKEKEELNRHKKGFPYFKKGPKIVRFCQNLILLEAGNSGDVEEVRRLLSEGVCPDVGNSDGLTALHQCAINNNVDMCRTLITYKANVNAKDKELWTPLHAAAICGHSGICQLLIKNGADLLALNTDGNMPYDICEDETTLDLIENEMAAKGITQDQINLSRKFPEQQMLKDIKLTIGRLGQSGALQVFSQLDKQGANLLHIASACGYIDVTKMLLSIGLPTDSLDKDGWQSVHVAALHSHLNVIEVLISNGANLDSQTKQGETVYELVFDEDVYEKLLLLKQKVEMLKENQNLSASTGLVRRRSSTNPRSASIRRTSMKEKSILSWKEARLEAEMRLSAEGKNPLEKTTISSRNNVQKSINDVTNYTDSFVNSSLRSKYFLTNDSIAETDFVDAETIKIEIELHKNAQNKLSAPTCFSTKTDSVNFSNIHHLQNDGGNSTIDRNSSVYHHYHSKSQNMDSKPINNTVKSTPKSVDINKFREIAVPKTQEINKQKQSVSSEKILDKKTNTLPHTYHNPSDEVIDAKPFSIKSNSKSAITQRPSTSSTGPRTSNNSINKNGSSSVLHKRERLLRSHINENQFNKMSRAARTVDSCCSVM